MNEGPSEGFATARCADWDAIVVGGGPAGSVSASLLARRGHRVLLLERSAFPRTKPCGESLNPGAVRELTELGLLPTIEALPHRPIQGWSIHPLAGRSFDGRFPSDCQGMAVDRALLDATLLRRAVADGVEVREGQHVVDLVRADGHRVVGVQTRDGKRQTCRMVLGCDGLRSTIMRRAGLLRRQPNLRKVALTGHVRGAFLGNDVGELHFLPWGTAGVVGIGADLANVVLVLDGGFRRGGESLESCFDSLIPEVPPLLRASRVGAVHATGPFDCPTRRVAAEGIMLVGDAAGYFDPFTGQGIYRALKGARLAAEAADRALRSDGSEGDALRRYASAHERAFRRGHLVQVGIERLTSRPLPFSYVARGLRRLPRAADFIVRLTGDVPTPTH